MPSLARTGLKRRIAGFGIGLIAVNLLVWLWALLALSDYPLLLGTALLAYSFGLRHAVDADHIAAIDNVTRKLMQGGQRPLAVGLFFSLGHSTVVVALSLLLAATTTALQQRFGDLRMLGGLIGTGVSALFLFAIAAANMVALGAVWRAFRGVRRGGRPDEIDSAAALAGGGLLSRLFGRLFALIGASWQMYPLGLLFGLGFDTATEVGLLGISALGASHGLSPWTIMVFPALFSAGMALVDTADGILMLGAYDWAFVKPIRKLYYNLTVTSVSVLVALLVGGIETLGLIADRLGLDGPAWRALAVVNDHFGLFGGGIVGVFALAWLVSLAIYRIKGYDDIEAVP